MEVLEKRFRPTVKGYVCHKLLLTKWWLVISRLDKKSNSNLICKCRMYIVFRCCKHLILIFHKCESIARIRQNKAAKPYVVHKSQQTMAHPETGSRSCKKTLTFYISLSVIFFEHTLEQNMWNLLVFEKNHLIRNQNWDVVIFHLSSWHHLHLQFAPFEAQDPTLHFALVT